MFCCTSCCKWYVGNNIRLEQFQGEERDMFLQSMKPELDGMGGWYKVQGLLASEFWWGSFSLVYYWTAKRLWKNDRFYKIWIQAFSFDSFLGWKYFLVLTRYGGSYKLGNLVKAVAGSFHTTDQLKMASKSNCFLSCWEVNFFIQKLPRFLSIVGFNVTYWPHAWSITLISRHSLHLDRLRNSSTPWLPEKSPSEPNAKPWKKFNVT